MWTLLITQLLIAQTFALPFQDTGFVIHSNGRIRRDIESKTDEVVLPSTIEKLEITSNIQLRYSLTEVEAYIKNPANKAQEVTFSLVLPSNAFVSNFSMVFKDGKEFVATVKPKEEAKKIYDQAVESSVGAGLVYKDVRNANQITVAANVEPGEKVTFKLSYEELLERHFGKYQQIIHLNLDQIVNDFSIDVHISESLPLKNVRVPALKTDPNAIEANLGQNLDAKINLNVSGDSSKAHISYKLDSAAQKKALLKNKEGIEGQLIVEYDVARNNKSDIQLLDGYFVHFFSPENLEALPKHIVFVLDLSGSMLGNKLKQTKDSMVTIMDSLNEKDHFNIITFSYDVRHWKPEGSSESLTYAGTPSMKTEAINYILKREAAGGTNIHGSLLEAIKVIKEVRSSETEIPPNALQLILFMTDGEATSGVTSRDDIKKDISEANQGLEVPIYSLAFGESADFDLMKEISLQSGVYARKIYEASDAAIQLEDFYLELSNPLLNNVKFQYVGELVDNTTLTKTDFKTYFKGGELVVAGKLAGDIPEGTELKLEVTGDGFSNDYISPDRVCIFDLSFRPCHFPPTIQPPTTTSAPVPKSASQNFIERLWAFLTIKNLLGENVHRTGQLLSEHLSVNNSKEARMTKALDLSLRYNFVTELTSLVVQKENEAPKTIDVTEVALKPEIPQHQLTSLLSFSYSNNFKSAPTYGIRDFQSSAYESANIETSSDIEVDTSSDIEVETVENETCQLKLFSQTYLRGESKIIENDTNQLDTFDDKTVSLLVSGKCCWILFEKNDYTGESIKFSRGAYKSASDLKNLFRKVSSAKKAESC